MCKSEYFIWDCHFHHLAVHLKRMSGDVWVYLSADYRSSWTMREKPMRIKLQFLHPVDLFSTYSSYICLIPQACLPPLCILPPFVILSIMFVSVFLHVFHLFPLWIGNHLNHLSHLICHCSVNISSHHNCVFVFVPPSKFIPSSSLPLSIFNLYVDSTSVNFYLKLILMLEICSIIFSILPWTNCWEINWLIKRMMVLETFWKHIKHKVFSIGNMWRFCCI